MHERWFAYFLLNPNKSIYLYKKQRYLSYHIFLASEYLEKPSYAFNANWLSNHDPNVGDALIFKNVLLNDEDVYNKYTGECTVKVNGTYTFSSTLCFVGNGYANVKFVADGKTLAIFRVGDHSWHLCTSSTTVDYLTKGNKVKVELLYKYKSNVLYDDPNGMLCSFSGHLIK